MNIVVFKECGNNRSLIKDLSMKLLYRFFLKAAK